MKKCLMCENLVVRERAKYCSVACSTLGYSLAKRTEYEINPNICKHCGGGIPWDRHRNLRNNDYCSNECGKISRSTAISLSNKRRSRSSWYDWKPIYEDYRKNNLTFRQVMQKYGCGFSAIDAAIKRGEFISRGKPPSKIDRILAGSGESYNRTALKEKLLIHGVLVNECYECRIGPEWNGKKLVLVLDHQNGIHNDDRFENLRLLCPNCNSQTSTFAGRRGKYKSNGVVPGTVTGQPAKLLNEGSSPSHTSNCSRGPTDKASAF